MVFRIGLYPFGSEAGSSGINGTRPGFVQGAGMVTLWLMYQYQDRKFSCWSTCTDNAIDTPSSGQVG